MPHLSDAELLARLVAFDTTSRNSNLPLADFLCDYLDRPACASRATPRPTAPRPTSSPGWDRAGGGTGRGLVLSGHMDVVPAEEEGWRSDPFTLTDGGDRWVARGACDMKGFLALAANLAAEARTATLRAPLALVFTYDEEVGTLGARRLIESFPAAERLPRNAIIGEPTSLRVAACTRGISSCGSPSTASPPTAAIRIWAQRHRARRPGDRRPRRAAPGRWSRSRRPTRELFPEVPFVPLNVGTVHGGSAINVVPDRCVVEVGVRPLPGIACEELVERVAAPPAPPRPRSSRRSSCSPTARPCCSTRTRRSTATSARSSARTRERASPSPPTPAGSAPRPRLRDLRPRLDRGRPQAERAPAEGRARRRPRPARADGPALLRGARA